jgi:hypothetical protein
LLPRVDFTCARLPLILDTFFRVFFRCARDPVILVAALRPALPLAFFAVDRRLPEDVARFDAALPVAVVFRDCLPLGDCFFAAAPRALVEAARSDFDFVFALLFAAVLRPVLRDFEPVLRPRAFVRPLERERLPCDSAVSREINLLKLLFCPPAVVSWCNNASPRSSNFSKKSSHEISSSESAPL